MALIRGIDLNTAQRRAVLAAFVHRHTEENALQTYGGKCPNCEQATRDGRIITGSRTGPVKLKEWTRAEWHAYHSSKGAKLQTDEAWLRGHAFYFIADGSRLNARRTHCEPVYLA